MGGCASPASAGGQPPFHVSASGNRWCPRRRYGAAMAGPGAPTDCERRVHRRTCLPRSRARGAVAPESRPAHVADRLSGSPFARRQRSPSTVVDQGRRRQKKSRRGVTPGQARPEGGVSSCRTESEILRVTRPDYARTNPRILRVLGAKAVRAAWHRCEGGTPGIGQLRSRAAVFTYLAWVLLQASSSSSGLRRVP